MSTIAGALPLRQQLERPPSFPSAAIDRMARSLATLVLVLSLCERIAAFAPVTRKTSASTTESSSLHARRTTTLVENPAVFDPLAIDDQVSSSLDLLRPASLVGATGLVAWAQQAVAESAISTGTLDPQGFVPVCPASDGFYRFLQGSTQSVVGKEAFVEYGPLIAGGLLRVRLELCVIESFVNEAVVPFVKENGVSWILPLHETVETFLAGVIFSLATTFILIGSSKILTIIATYADFIIGLPFRLFGGFFFDRARGKPVTLDIGLGPFKTRLVGPPKVEGADEEDKAIWELEPLQLVPAILSGTVKVTGQAVGVS